MNLTALYAQKELEQIAEKVENSGFMGRRVGDLSAEELILYISYLQDELKNLSDRSNMAINFLSTT